MNGVQELFIHSLFESMYKPLYRFAHAKLGDSQRAEELVQDAFLLAIEMIDEVMRSPSPNGWVMNAMKYLIKREYRTRTYFNKVFSPVPIEDINNQVAQYDSYEIELRSLFTDGEWHLIKAALIDGKPISEIAAEMNIEYEACKKRLQKLKAYAKSKLQYI